MYRRMGMRGMGQLIVDDAAPSKQYCAIKPGMCITAESKRYLDSLRCEIPRVKGYSTRGGLRGLGRSNSICSMYTRLFPGHIQSNFDPCEVKRANLPVCAPPPAPPVRTNTPDTPVTTFDEPEEDDDGNMYMIGGILAVLVVGGVGYAVFRKKGKKKRKKR